MFVKYILFFFFFKSWLLSLDAMKLKDESRLWPHTHTHNSVEVWYTRLCPCFIWSEKCLFKAWAMYKHWNPKSLISYRYVRFLNPEHNSVLGLVPDVDVHELSKLTDSWKWILKTSEDKMTAEHVSGESVSQLQRNSLPASVFYCGWNRVVVMPCHDRSETKETIWENTIPTTWSTHTNYHVFASDAQDDHKGKKEAVFERLSQKLDRKSHFNQIIQLRLLNIKGCLHNAAVELSSLLLTVYITLHWFSLNVMNVIFSHVTMQ